MSVIAATLGLLFIAGIAYSVYITKWPFPRGLTWLAVVVGCCFTNVAISVVTWELTADWKAALVVPWGCYTLTGLPMILGQVFKEQRYFSETCEFMESRLRDEA